MAERKRAARKPVPRKARRVSRGRPTRASQNGSDQVQVHVRRLLDAHEAVIRRIVANEIRGAK
jgi:hypothetical protein